jgi:hypothetical protein
LELRLRDALRSVAAGVALTLVAGCGGGNYERPLVVESGAGSSATASVGSSSTTSTVSASGVETTLSLPGSASSSSVAITESAMPPNGSAALQSVRRVQSTAGTALTYVALTFASTVTLPSLPSFSFTLASVASGSEYFVGFLDPSKGSTYALGAEGPGIVAGSIVGFVAPSGSVTFTAGTVYVFTLYAASLAPLVTSSTALTFSALGAAAAQPITVSETGYSGSFTAVSSNPSVVSVTGPSGTTPTFTVTPVAGGSATITISDHQGQSTPVSVSVTSATFVPQ